MFFCLLIPEIFKKTEKRFTFEISFSQEPISLLLFEIYLELIYCILKDKDTYCEETPGDIWILLYASWIKLNHYKVCSCVTHFILYDIEWKYKLRTRRHFHLKMGWNIIIV